MAHPIPPGAAPKVPIPPAAPAAALPRAAPRMYRKLYSDDEYNPAPGRTGGYLAGYRSSSPAGGAQVPTPSALRD